MNHPRGSRLAALIFALASGTILAVACSDNHAASTAASTASGTASASAAAPDPSATAAEKTSDDDVKPIYPIDGSPPDPLAQRFCQTVHDVEAGKRGDCCGVAGDTGYFTGECTRTLSY